MPSSTAGVRMVHTIAGLMKRSRDNGALLASVQAVFRRACSARSVGRSSHPRCDDGWSIIMRSERTLRRNLLAKEDLVPAEGTIIDKQPNAFFKVQLDNSAHVVLAAISGKMRKHRIRILVGDRVSVEMSPYDLSRGRITYRYK